MQKVKIKLKLNRRPLESLIAEQLKIVIEHLSDFKTILEDVPEVILLQSNVEILRSWSEKYLVVSENPEIKVSLTPVQALCYYEYWLHQVDNFNEYERVCLIDIIRQLDQFFNTSYKVQSINQQTPRFLL